MESLSEEEQQLLRTCINSRERRRMHDLNDSLDDLRRVIPYANTQDGGGNGGPPRKISKINTIILAANWIRQLNKEVAELKAQLARRNGDNETTTEPEGKRSRVLDSTENGQHTPNSPSQLPSNGVKTSVSQTFAPTSNMPGFSVPCLLQVIYFIFFILAS